MRLPAVAGQFYPGTSRALTEAVSDCFLNGPGKVPYPLTGVPRVGVAPHAGYVFSGPTAARTISALSPSIKGSVILIGPNHTGLGGPADLSMMDFETPIGTVHNDLDLSNELIKNGITHGEGAHVHEHSLEVQLPLLLNVNPDIRISPIVMGDQSIKNIKKVAKAISKVIRKDDILLASSDFTHCGPSYGQPLPRGMTAGEYAKKRDMPAIDKINVLDTDGFLRLVQREGITICGAGPIAVAMEVAKTLGSKKGELLEYTTSYDISPGPMAVGYGSLVFY